MASTLDLLKLMAGHEAHVVVVGGVAGVLDGSPLVTQDVGLCKNCCGSPQFQWEVR